MWYAKQNQKANLWVFFMLDEGRWWLLHIPKQNQFGFKETLNIIYTYLNADTQ